MTPSTTGLVPTLPDTPLALSTLSFVASAESVSTANHSIRSYLFAVLLAHHRGIELGQDVDVKLLFLACVMHDLGLSDEGNRNQRFEIDGADTAAEFLAGRGLPAIEVDLVWEAIALHTTPGIAERRGALAFLTRAGIGMDFGREAELLTDQQASAIHAAYPRFTMASTLVDEIVAQTLLRPGKAPPYSMAAELVRDRAARGSTLIEDGATGSRWGS